MAQALKIPTPADVAAEPAAPMRLATNPPRGAKWIGLAEAEKRSGLSRRTLQQLCAQQWQKAGTARTVTSRGGRPSWQVREDADVRVARVKFPDQMEFRTAGLTEAQVRAAQDRRSILLEWENARADGTHGGLVESLVTERFILRLERERGLKLSRATLFNWQRCWRSAGLNGLVDRRGYCGTGDGDGDGGSDPFYDEIKRLYLTPRQLKIPKCYWIAAMKAAEYGWPVRSIHQCRRFLESLPRALVLKLRHGEEAYVNDAEPFIERDYSGLKSNEVWCGDHHRFDVMVSYRGRHVRPWLTAWQDLRSRKIVGWQVFAEAPNTDTILAAFRDGVLSFGVPESVLIDNGKDFDSYALHGRTKQQRRAGVDPSKASGVFAMLNVRARFCWPYHGQSKPIERWFGTVADEVRAWETYCGNAPGNRPEDLGRQLARDKAPTLEEFRDWFAGWLPAYNASAHHGADMHGKSPDQVYAENLTEKRTAPAGTLDLLLMKATRPVKVHQNGVSYASLNYGQYEPELHRRLGEQVTLRLDPKVASRVLVCDLEGRSICWAACNERIPANATHAELKDAIAAKREDRKRVKEYYDRPPRLHRDLAEEIVQSRAANALPAPSDPRPIKTPIQTSIEVPSMPLQTTVNGAFGELVEQSRPRTGGRFIYESPSREESERLEREFRETCRREREERRKQAESNRLDFVKTLRGTDAQKELAS